MGKIVSIRNDSVIARTDDGQVKIIPKSGLDFEPVVGEEVEIITSGSKVIFKQKSHETVKEFEQEIKQTAKNPEPNPTLTKSHSTPRGRIIGIQEGIVTIGKTDKSIQEVRIEDCNFQPNINDEVEIFSSANRTLVVKIEKSSANTSASTAPVNNINVLVANKPENDPRYKKVEIKVNKLKYCLFALSLGWCGIQRFSEEKIIAGSIFAFLGFVHFVGALVNCKMGAFLLYIWMSIPGIFALIDLFKTVEQKLSKEASECIFVFLGIIYFFITLIIMNTSEASKYLWLSIPSLVAIFDFFKVVTKSSDEEGNVCLIQMTKVENNIN